MSGGTFRMLDEQVPEAELIFESEVINIEHRTSTAGKRDAAEIPHAFATHLALDGIKEGIPGEEVTLRFLEGPPVRDRCCCSSRNRRASGIASCFACSADDSAHLRVA
jgi:hypothetical protein